MFKAIFQIVTNKTFMMGMTIIAAGAFPLSAASMLSAQLVLWIGGLCLAAVSFH
jgi:hypothetical protein